jgi:hypothetical protein
VRIARQDRVLPLGRGMWVLYKGPGLTPLLLGALGHPILFLIALEADAVAGIDQIKVVRQCHSPSLSQPC